MVDDVGCDMDARSGRDLYESQGRGESRYTLNMNRLSDTLGRERAI